MSENITVPDKITGQLHTAAELNQQTQWIKTPIQPLTVFTDSDIIVDGSKSFSTIKAITAASHTININPTLLNHKFGNTIDSRYSFSQACNLTIQNNDSFGSLVGTIDPIPAGTYDIYFYAGPFGVKVFIPSNPLTIPVTTPLEIGNFTIVNSTPTRINFTSNKTDISASTFADFSLDDPTKLISSLFINSGSLTGHYFVVSVAYVIGDLLPTISYDGTDDWTSADGDLEVFAPRIISNLIGFGLLFMDTFTGSVINSANWSVFPSSDVSITQNDSLIFTALVTDFGIPSVYITTLSKFFITTTGVTTVFKFKINDSVSLPTNVIRQVNFADSSFNNGLIFIPTISDRSEMSLYVYDGGTFDVFDLNVVLAGSWKAVMDGAGNLTLFKHNGASWGTAILSTTYAEVTAGIITAYMSGNIVLGDIWGLDDMFVTDYDFATLNP